MSPSLVGRCSPLEVPPHGTEVSDLSDQIDHTSGGDGRHHPPVASQSSCGMDPLSALSLAVAVAQFVDYGFKILGNAREIHGSLLGATQENQSLEKATLEMQRLTDKLVSSKLGGPTDEDKMLDGLVTECRSLSSQLLNLLNMIKARDPKSKTQIFSAALRAKRYEKEKIRLQRRLDECQLRLDRLLGALSRFVLTFKVGDDEAALC